MNLALLRFLGWLENTVGKAPRREDGQGLVEYALIIALIAVVVIVAIVALRGQITAIFDHISSCLGNSSSCTS